MTTDPAPDPILPVPPPLPSSPPLLPPPSDLWAEARHWAKILLARNPFYIISAALLVWSMRRLSLDSRIFHDEFPQLLFNFSSFQFYELLLAGTAIVLARRRVWYDAGLLIGLENLFVCVPFLLVSQALLLENWIAFALCLTGCGLALLRVGALRRWLTESNMPASLLCIGAILLCFNLGWPVLIRYLHKDLSLPAWDARGLTLTSLQWNWIIPATVALALLLPNRFSAAALRPEEEAPFFVWRSFPLLALLMWIAGTCVHLYCISYVYGLPWRENWLIPALWVAAWVLWRQIGNLTPEMARPLVQRLLLVPPAFIVLVSGGSERWTMCLTLASLNAAVFGLIALVKRERLASCFCVLSGLIMCWHLPDSALVQENPNLIPILCRGGLIALISWAVLSDRPKLGIAGGLCLMIVLAGLLSKKSMDVNYAVQAGLIFILLHSFRWQGMASSDILRARILCAVFWLAHTIAWVAAMPAHAISGTMACGAAVLVVCGIVRILQGKWGQPVVAWSAVAVASWGPIYFAGNSLLRAPDGLLFLLGSFLLFGLGTLVALMKSSGIGPWPARKGFK